MVNDGEWLVLDGGGDSMTIPAHTVADRFPAASKARTKHVNVPYMFGVYGWE